MDFFDKVKQLFRTAEPPPGEAFDRQLIERSEADIAQFDHWKASPRRERLIDSLRQDFFAKADPLAARDADLRFVQSDMANGLVYYPDARLSTPTETRHLFDFFRERIQPEGYMTQLGDQRIYLRKERTEFIERYHLKPKPYYDSELGVYNQQFGNITIERVLHDEEVKHIKLLCSFYNDRSYTEPRDFDELVRILLD